MAPEEFMMIMFKGFGDWGSNRKYMKSSLRVTRAFAIESQVGYDVLDREWLLQSVRACGVSDKQLDSASEIISGSGYFCGNPVL